MVQSLIAYGRRGENLRRPNVRRELVDTQGILALGYLSKLVFQAGRALRKEIEADWALDR